MRKTFIAVEVILLFLIFTSLQSYAEDLIYAKGLHWTAGIMMKWKSSRSKLQMQQIGKNEVPKKPVISSIPVAGAEMHVLLLWKTTYQSG